MVVMAALVIDGGNAFLARRLAQTAADAGALAGAYEYCINEQEPTTVITEYVEVQNHAVLENWYIDSDNGEIVVEVSITNDNYFAKIFGSPTTIVRANAAASCFPPGIVSSVLPIAWSCRPPLPGMPSDSEDCEWKAIPWDIMQEIVGDPLFVPTGEDGTLLYDSGGDTADSYLGGPGSGDLTLYLVMDNIPSAAEIPCIQTDPINGDIDCDLDGDGRIDILGNGNRSWMILDGDENNAQLDEIVKGELQLSVTTPTWYPGREGAIVDVYKDAKDYIEGEAALIPIFEAVCAATTNPLLDDKCASVRGEEDGLVQISTAASWTYFRVTSFAEFYVTCVSNKPKNHCPGKDLAVSYGIVEPYTPSIEGYFVEGWVIEGSSVGTGTSELDLGVYILSLTE
ncbi:hypothetical protein KQH61_03670 [bacterium]|nr:hypothetical protein [bacterium]MCB2179000.1 hypothetical protein [bacterium]